MRTVINKSMGADNAAMAGNDVFTRNTRARRLILDVLRAKRWHPTADEILAVVHRQMPRVSLATVYRNLDLLSAAGIILTLSNDGQQRRYDGCTDAHGHVRCRSCGRLDDLAWAPHSRLMATGQKHTEQRLVGCHVDFIGVCPTCDRPKERAGGKKRVAAPDGREVAPKAGRRKPPRSITAKKSR